MENVSFWQKNRPVNCLSEAMDLFMKLAGRPVQPIDYGQLCFESVE